MTKPDLSTASHPYSSDLAAAPPLPTAPAAAVVGRALLSAAVNAVARAAADRKSIPILANVLLQATGAGLILRCSDLDREISCPVAGAVAPNFAVTVPAHVLAKVLKEAKAGDTVTITAGASMAVLDFSGLKVMLNTLPTVDFPQIVAGSWAHEFTLRTADFVRALKRTEFAISTEETRYYLNGVFMHNGAPGTLRFVATDGHKMAIADIAAPESSAGMPGVIVPRQTVAELIYAARGKGAPETVTIRLGDGLSQFVIGDIVITSKLINGTFPNYARVVPSGNDKRMTIAVESLDTSIKQVMMLSPERGRSVKLSMTDSRLRLCSMDPDTGSASADLACDYASDPMDIGFNSEYLRSILANVESDSVAFMLADSGSPALIRGAGDADRGVSFVLMPKRI